MAVYRLTNMMKSQLPTSQITGATTPVHSVRNSTPVRNGTQPPESSSAAPPVPVLSPLPTKAAAHGAPARRYLNERVTGILLEGMKRLAAEQ